MLAVRVFRPLTGASRLSARLTSAVYRDLSRSAKATSTTSTTPTPTPAAAVAATAAATATAATTTSVLPPLDSSSSSSSPNAADQPVPLSKFPLSEKTQEHLTASGVAGLFPIQAHTFMPAFEGKDVLGRARTGTGKTLAYLLPVLEKLEQQGEKKIKGHKMIILSPTRELAKQVHTAIQTFAPSWKSCCIYGGVGYDRQLLAIDTKVDVIVACPGRLIDLMETRDIDFSTVKTVVLDEADVMLDMGFSESTEKILDAVKASQKEATTHFQTLLFSATVPDWVRKLVKRFMRRDHVTVDLVGDEKMQTNTNIRHLVAKVSHNRGRLMSQLITVHAGAGQSIIFVDTQKEAMEIIRELTIPDVQMLHGGMTQFERDKALAAFRAGEVRCLVATDVAARGLDIPNVELTVCTRVPSATDKYIHRCGRAGRAGRKGVSIIIASSESSRDLKNLVAEGGFEPEHVSSPTPAELSAASSEVFLKLIENTSQAPYGKDKRRMERASIIANHILSKIPAEKEAVAAAISLLNQTVALDPNATFPSALEACEEEIVDHAETRKLTNFEEGAAKVLEAHSAKQALSLALLHLCRGFAYRERTSDMRRSSGGGGGRQGDSRRGSRRDDDRREPRRRFDFDRDDRRGGGDRDRRGGGGGGSRGGFDRDRSGRDRDGDRDGGRGRSSGNRGRGGRDRDGGDDDFSFSSSRRRNDDSRYGEFSRKSRY